MSCKQGQPRAPQRGFSLALVLLVASIAITVGFAMAALSSFSLNLAAQTLNQARAQALARAVTSQICFELDQRVWNKNPWELSTFPDLSYGSDAIRQRFRTLPLFPDPGQKVLDGSLNAWVDFDSPKWFSVDNLTFEEPRPGYADVGTARASVPPFSLSLIVNTGIGDNLETAADPRHFESVICRSWPYAAYGLKPAIRVSGGSVVRGGLFDQTSVVQVGDASTDAVAVQGDICVRKERKDTVITTGPSSTLSGRVRYGVTPPVGPTYDTMSDDAISPMGEDEMGPVGVDSFQIPVPESALQPSADGVTGSTNHLDPFNAHPMDGLSTFQPVYVSTSSTVTLAEIRATLVSQWPSSVPMPQSLRDWIRDQTNRILTRVSIWHGNPLQKLTDLSVYSGRIKFRFPAKATKATSGFGAYGEDGSVDARVLVEALNLSDGIYCIPHSVTNHFGVETSDSSVVEDLWTGNRDGPSGVNLQDAVLIVMGDLDIRGLKGDNSTIYVTGNLFLHGGKLEAGNKGMLVLASNVVIEAEGDFRGVIAAKGSVKLQPLPGTGRLKVRGAVMAEGRGGSKCIQDASGTVRLEPSAPLVIDNTTLLYDRSYTKVLNRVGTCRQLVFREVQ